MMNTVNSIHSEWDWTSGWGWDFGLMAMAALRLDRDDLFFEFLLYNATLNTFGENGANYGRGMPYLPGNGAVLLAIGMASGGFGSNHIRLQGLQHATLNVKGTGDAGEANKDVHSSNTATNAMRALSMTIFPSSEKLTVILPRTLLCTWPVPHSGC